MSLNALTFAQLQAEATHAIAGVPDPNAPLDRIVNGALEYLCNISDWTWRTAIATLDFQGGVGQIPLPSDFGQIIDLVGFNAKYTAVKPANWRDIIRVRVHGVPDQQICIYHVGSAGQYAVPNPIATPTTASAAGGTLTPGTTYFIRQSWLGAVSGETAGGPEIARQVATGQGSINVTVGAAPAGAGNANIYVSSLTGVEQLAGSVAGNGTLNITALPASTAAFVPQFNTTVDQSVVPQRVLEIAPLPSTGLSQALYLTYRKLVPKLVQNSDVPALPYGMHDLLRLLVRAFAYSSTVGQPGEDWRMFTALLPSFVAADGLAQGSPGKLIDALNEDDGLYATQPWTSIRTAYDP